MGRSIGREGYGHGADAAEHHAAGEHRAGAGQGQQEGEDQCLDQSEQAGVRDQGAGGARAGWLAGLGGGVH